MTVPPEEHKPNLKDEPETKPTFLGGIINLFKGNFLDTIAYIILALSLIYTCFNSFNGGLIAGFIMGLYFSSYVFKIVRQFREFLITDGIFKGFVLIAALVAFMIAASGLALGLFLGTFMRPIFGHAQKTGEEESKKDEPTKNP